MKHRDEIFTLELRRQIYQNILKYPGLHLRELSREMNLPKSTLVYHINHLLKRNMISINDSSGYERFFIKEEFNNKNKKLIALIREKVPHNLILYFCLYQKTNQRELIDFAKRWENHPSKIAKSLNKHPTTLSYHLNKLVELGIIDRIQKGNEVMYSLNDIEGIYDLLITYNKRLFGNNFKKVIKWMQDDSGTTLIVDKVMKNLFDVFPHPYYI